MVLLCRAVAACFGFIIKHYQHKAGNQYNQLKHERVTVKTVFHTLDIELIILFIRTLQGTLPVMLHFFDTGYYKWAPALAQT
jgi:hypothetical protein